MKISSITECGPHRKENEDAVNYGFFDTGDCYAVVCDGMGGVSGGKLASSICVQKTSEAIERGYRKRLTIKGAKNLLESAIWASNSAIEKKSTEDYGYRGMGTTIVAAAVIGNVAVIAHVGDSRAYLISQSGISQVTKDHSLVQTMIDCGKITQEEALTHPERNIITRAVGISNFVDVEFDIIDLNNTDSVLLCTDGLSGSLRENEIYEIIKTDSSIDKLVQKAIDNGSTDNVTALLIQGE